MKRVIILVFLPVLIGGCRQEIKPNFSTSPFIIDTHTHYRPADDWEKSFLDVYTRYNAMVCLLINMKDIDRGINFARAHPDRVIPYAAV